MARLRRDERRWSSRPGVLVRGVCSGGWVLPWDPANTGLRKNPTSLNRASLSRIGKFAALVLTLAVACWGIPAFAQTDVNDVHIDPRVVEKPPEAAKQDLLTPSSTNSTTGLSAHIRPLKVDVDLVLVPVTITDPMNRLVTGLDKENFQLFEGNATQQIRTFSAEDAPVSLGVIFDSSGSMSSKMERAKDAVVEFFKTANPQDEFFMITFSDEPEEVSDFTSSVDEIQNKLVFAVPRRRTALLDAIYMGVSKMRQAKYPKKALLIISDGGDNHSRYTEGEIRSLVKEADVMIYAIGIYDRYASAVEERLGPQLLSDITELTGGRAFTIDNPNDLGDVATKIGVELRNQYVLGYRPTKVMHDGKWRKIKVKLLPPKGLPPLRVYARTGYYAPAE
jgi:Ca-activated chloride channel homolog